MTPQSAASTSSKSPTEDPEIKPVTIDTEEEVPPEKVLQLWLAQGVHVLPLRATTPTHLTIMNSLATAELEEKSREFIADMGRDLQDIDDERLKSFRDRHWLIEIKKMYASKLAHSRS